MAIPGAQSTGNITAIHAKASIGTNRYGEWRYDAPVSLQINIGDLEYGPEQTTRRADAGASEGFGMELVAKGSIFVPPGTVINNNDKMTVNGQDFRVIGQSPNYNTKGCSSSTEVQLAIFQTG